MTGGAAVATARAYPRGLPSPRTRRASRRRSCRSGACAVSRVVAPPRSRAAWRANTQSVRGPRPGLREARSAPLGAARSDPRRCRPRAFPSARPSTAFSRPRRYRSAGPAMDLGCDSARGRRPSPDRRRARKFLLLESALRRSSPPRARGSRALLERHPHPPCPFRSTRTAGRNRRSGTSAGCVDAHPTTPYTRTSVGGSGGASRLLAVQRRIPFAAPRSRRILARRKSPGGVRGNTPPQVKQQTPIPGRSAGPFPSQQQAQSSSTRSWSPYQASTSLRSPPQTNH